jgi:hypothetical protein
MIRPNLRSFAAAVACLISSSSLASAQDGLYRGGPPSHGPAGRPPIQDHYLRGNTELWDENRPIERFVGRVASQSWLKLEFLMWNYDSGSHDQIGAPVLGLQQNTAGEVQGQTLTVPLLDNLNGGADIGEALFPFASGIDHNDIPGIRGTLGVALTGAEMELSFFGMEQSSDFMAAEDLSAARTRVGLTDVAFGTTAFPNLAVPLLTDGQPGTLADLNALIFSESFSARMESQMWGSEFALLTEKSAPGGAGASLQWLGGFRYVSVDEGFGFSGTSVGTPVTSVNSSTINNFYGPQIGARAALTSKYFTLSATPRIMMGLNDNTSTVSSVYQGVAGITHRDRTVDFGTVTQINLAAELHVSPQFSIYGGYDFMVLTGVSQAFDNVVYDTTLDGVGARVADIRQHVDLGQMFVNGFSLGAVFRY